MENENSDGSAGKAAEGKDRKYFTLPNSPSSNQVMSIVSHVSDMDVFQERLSENSHSSRLDFFSSPKEEAAGARRVKFETEHTETVIHLDNIELFMKANKPLKKFFTYILVKLSDEVVSPEMQKDICIKFPLQDFVDLGCYGSVVTARQAFNSLKDPLTSIKIEGIVKDRKDVKTITDSGIEVLFTGAHVKNGIVEIYLNHRINWSVFALQYFSILPKSYFSLSDRASDMLLNIFIIARKRLNDIGRDGSFNISFRTVQQILGLPDEKETKNPSRDIREAVIRTLEEVSETEKKDLDISLSYNGNGNITEFLEEGYVKVSLRNEYLKYFDSLARIKKNKIESSIRKRDEVRTRARIKAEASRLG